MWSKIEEKDMKVLAKIGGKDCVLFVPKGKEDATEKMLKLLCGQVDLLEGFSGSYDELVADIAKLNTEEDKLKKQISALRDRKKSLKDDSTMNREGSLDAQLKIKEYLEHNPTIFKEANIEGLFLGRKIGKVGNKVGATRGRGNIGKYDDTYVSDWSEMKKSGISWNNLVGAVNTKYGDKMDLQGHKIHFNTMSTLRGVVENWEIKNGLRVRGSKGK